MTGRKLLPLTVRRFGVVALVLSLLVVSAPAYAAQVTGCPPQPHYRVVAQGPRAVVAATAFTKVEGAQRERVTVYRACLRSRTTSIFVMSERGGFGDTSAVGMWRFAGRFVAGVDSYGDRYGNSGQTIEVTDLKGESASRPRGYGAAASSDEKVVALTVSTRGYLAWIVRDASSERLTVGIGASLKTLDQGAPGSITIKSLEGTTLRWTNAEQAREATLRTR